MYPQQYPPPRKVITRSKRPTNHTFHLIMTLCTFGCWAPVWAWMTVQNMIFKQKSITQ